MTWIPGIKQISQVGNDMYAQGAITIAGIGTTEVAYLADPADTRLLAGRDPVLEEVSVGMSGVETDTKYATGTQPLTVTDAMQGNLLYCEVQFSPKQDLHGYDSPWPAGGGKNKWNPTTGGTAEGTYNGITYNKNNDGSYSFSGTATGSTWIDFGNVTLPAGTWTASVTKTGLYTGTISVGAKSGAFITYPNLTNYPRTVTSESETTGLFGINFASGVAISGTLTLWIQIESGSSATSYAPYSNICPITYITDVNVYVAPAYDPSAAPEATVSLGAERYGGTAEIVSGTGSEQYSEVDLGTLTWTKHSTGVMYAPITMKAVTASTLGNSLCSQYKQQPSNLGFTTSYDFSYWQSAVGNYLYVYDSNLATGSAAEFATAMSGVKFSYERATPVYYNFPGENSITLQQGTNTIWTDTNGTDISVTYVTKK